EVLHIKGIPIDEALKIESKAMDRFHSVECLGLPVMPCALEALRELDSLGAVVGIVTGRPTHTGHLTAKWLADKAIPYSWFKHTNDKATASNGWNLFVDDAVHHALAVKARGIPVCLMDYPWNRSLSSTPGITRVSGWQEIVAVY